MNAYLLLLTALLATMVYEASAIEGVSTGTALAFGIAAVLGLKLAGVAGFAIARSVGGRRGGRGGRGGRRFGRRRGRRDVAAEFDEDQEEAYFQLVEQVDSLGCGLRVVCELEAKEASLLQADEKIILSLFGSRPLPPSYNALKATAAGKYQLAAFVGAEKKDAKRCSQVFSKCPFTSEQLLQALRAAPGGQ